MTDHLAASHLPSDERAAAPSVTALSLHERQIVLSRLQRSGAALTACECGSRNWLPPEAVHELPGAVVWPANGAPGKLVIPITCAVCGLIKLYDPAVVGALNALGAGEGVSGDDVAR